MRRYVLYDLLHVYPVRASQLREYYHLEIACDVLLMLLEEASDDIHGVVTEKEWTVWDNPDFWYDQTIDQFHQREYTHPIAFKKRFLL